MSAFRCLFSSKVNYLLSDTSVDFYAYVQSQLGVDLKLAFVGYLWLLSEKEYGELHPILKELAASNLKFEEFEAEELARRLHLNVCLTGDEEAEVLGLSDIYKGVFIPKAGIVDADCIVKFYEDEFLKLGGEIRYGVKVESLIVEPCKPLGIQGEPFFWQKSRVSGVKTDAGIVKAKKTVLAAGAWTPSF